MPTPKVPTPEPTPEPTQPAPASAGVLDRLRANRMGGLVGGLIVAGALGLLLSVLVPDTQVLLALSILSVAIAVGVGAAVRVSSGDHGLLTQASAFVATVIGVHVMSVTGMVHQGAQDLNSAAEALGADFGVAWDDALLAALATPAVSSGAVVAGLIAAIIAGWGPRDSRA